MKKKEKRRD